MKGVFLSGVIFGALLTLAVATTTIDQVAQASSNQVSSSPAERTDLGPEARDDGGHHHHYHYSHGQELFAGDEWMLAIPLLVIPLVALACWYFWGGSKDDGYGWDRMGYSDSSYSSQPAAYESRMLRGADAMDKRTHQRIFNAIQQ